jgi:hypothetical protein
VLQSVVIRRVGAAADAFDINAQGLPVVTSQPLSIGRFSSNLVSLTFSNRIYTENFVFTTAKPYVPGTYTNAYVITNYFITNVVMGVTNDVETNATHTDILLNTSYATNIYDTNFAVWGSYSLGIEVPNSPITNTTYYPIVQDSGYFRLAQIVYPPIYAPRTLRNRKLTLNFDDGLGTIVVNFDNSNGGTYTSPGDPPGTIKNYGWYQSLYQGDLDPITYSLILPMSLTFYFTNLSNGVFNGSVNSAASFPVTGTFTLSP